MRRCGLLLLALAACASASSTDGTVDASGSGNADASGPRDAGDDAPTDAPVSACPSTDTCAAAMLLGSVSGDSGVGKLTAMGHQSAWFRVRVTEDNSEPFGLKLRVAAKLTSPASANFDVFVYVNSGSDVIECTTPTGTATTTGNVDQTRIEWGEGTISNGNADDRTVSIEVRPVSGTCAPGQQWQLEIDGNWL